MREWQVLLNGIVWIDNFDSEDMAMAYIEEQVVEGNGEWWEFEIQEMTGKDLKNAYLLRIGG